MHENTISHPDMVRVLAKSGADILATLTAHDCHVMHMIWGMSGEIGEMIGFTDFENLVEEMGDFEFYFEGLRQEYSISLAELTGWDFSEGENLDLTNAEDLQIAFGDLSDLLKKEVIYRKGPPDRDVLVKAMARVEWHLNCIREVAGIVREDAITANIKKLGKRYEGFKYSDAAAQARADKEPEKNDASEA